MNALVTLLVPPFQDLTYRLPDCFPDSFWQPGLRVAVPLGGGPARPGVIRELDVPAPEGVRLKNVLWPLETTPLLCRGVMELNTLEEVMNTMEPLADVLDQVFGS